MPMVSAASAVRGTAPLTTTVTRKLVPLSATATARRSTYAGASRPASLPGSVSATKSRNGLAEERVEGLVPWPVPDVDVLDDGVAGPGDSTPDPLGDAEPLVVAGPPPGARDGRAARSRLGVSLVFWGPPAAAQDVSTRQAAATANCRFMGAYSVGARPIARPGPDCWDFD